MKARGTKFKIAAVLISCAFLAAFAGCMSTRVYHRELVEQLQSIRINSNIDYMSGMAVGATSTFTSGANPATILLWGPLPALAFSKSASDIHERLKREAPMIEPIVAEVITNYITVALRHCLNESGLPFRIVDDQSAQAEIRLFVSVDPLETRSGMQVTHRLMLHMNTVVLHGEIPGSYDHVWSDHVLVMGEKHSLPPYSGMAYHNEKDIVQTVWKEMCDKAVQALVTKMQQSMKR